jgi:hypothetical protein
VDQDGGFGLTAGLAEPVFTVKKSSAGRRLGQRMAALSDKDKGHIVERLGMQRAA